MKNVSLLGAFGAALVILASTSIAPQAARAGNATWSESPSSGDWNTAANWVPATVPNGSGSIATLAASNLTDISFSQGITVGGIIFDSGASAYTISFLPEKTFTITGSGIANNSSSLQTFVIPPTDTVSRNTSLEFNGHTSASSGTAFIIQGNTVPDTFAGARVTFYKNSSAGSATIVVEGSTVDGSDGSTLGFEDFATAGSATVTTLPGTVNGAGGAATYFTSNSSADHGTFTIEGATVPGAIPGEMDFYLTSTAGDAIVTNDGGLPQAPYVRIGINFYDRSTAGNAVITNNGGDFAGAVGGRIRFEPLASPDNATIINNGGTVAGATGGTTHIFGDAGTSTLIANPGTNGGEGGRITFEGISDGGPCRVEVFGNGKLDISHEFNAVLSIGSLEGDGSVFLGRRTLSVGSNNATTTFSGILRDGGKYPGKLGMLEKVGSGALFLTGPSIYTGGTTVSDGALFVNNLNGSGTGKGPVTVTNGTIGGTGAILGALTLGTGTGSGAFLAPSQAANAPTTFGTAGAVTFRADSTYICKLNPKKARADRLTANGVSIDGDAQFDLAVVANKKLDPGTVFRVIKNTAATPISGTFANLADGDTVIIGQNSYQADYEGGDGNDLTLTVLP